MVDEVAGGVVPSHTHVAQHRTPRTGRRAVFPLDPQLGDGGLSGRVLHAFVGGCRLVAVLVLVRRIKHDHVRRRALAARVVGRYVPLVRHALVIPVDTLQGTQRGVAQIAAAHAVGQRAHVRILNLEVARIAPRARVGGRAVPAVACRLVLAVQQHARILAVDVEALRLAARSRRRPLQNNLATRGARHERRCIRRLSKGALVHRRGVADEGVLAPADGDARHRAVHAIGVGAIDARIVGKTHCTRILCIALEGRAVAIDLVGRAFATIETDADLLAINHLVGDVCRREAVVLVVEARHLLRFGRKGVVVAPDTLAVLHAHGVGIGLSSGGLRVGQLQDTVVAHGVGIVAGKGRLARIGRLGALGTPPLRRPEAVEVVLGHRKLRNHGGRGHEVVQLLVVAFLVPGVVPHRMREDGGLLRHPLTGHVLREIAFHATLGDGRDVPDVVGIGLRRLHKEGPVIAVPRDAVVITVTVLSHPAVRDRIVHGTLIDLRHKPPVAVDVEVVHHRGAIVLVAAVELVHLP